MRHRTEYVSLQSVFQGKIFWVTLFLLDPCRSSGGMSRSGPQLHPQTNASNLNQQSRRREVHHSYAAYTALDTSTA
jgi:hypothetical protein